MPIRKLPTLLVNQIAAGEVIERPASVVKELVENALDAGATRIGVAVENGGADLIRISDDGGGIPEDELGLAVAPHATSKLHEAGDLEAIQTLGFRGEALASIGSVSRMRITTRPRQAEAASVLEVAGDEVSASAPAGGSPGTVIEVRDLFFNTPARRKFLRTPATEFAHINDTLSRIAMMHPGVGFTLTHNDRKVTDLSPDGGWRRRCVGVLGEELDEALMSFDELDRPDRGGTHVFGLAGMPAIARSSGKFQYLCVNGRVVRDRQLTHAVKEAYRGLIAPDKQPVAVVFVEMDPREVDVNVHPAKAEVRFRNPSQVHGLVLSALRQRLLGADLTPVAGGEGRWALGAGAGRGGESKEAPPGAPSSPSDFVDYFKRMDPTQKGFVYEQVKRAVEAEDPGSPSDWSQPAAGTQPPAATTTTTTTTSILQVSNSYVVTQDDTEGHDGGVLIVDQHALHERVMFEQLRQRILGENKPLESQRLLMPATMPADAGRQAILEQLKPLLERLGIEVELMGPKTVGIQAFPTFLFSRNVEPGEFLPELLDAVEDGRLHPDTVTTDEAALHEVLDMMACKAAVKAGDKLTPDELTALLAQRKTVERSSNCPHGRPTTIRLSLRDLEKQFGRG